jgi:hypothetical protein
VQSCHNLIRPSWTDLAVGTSICTSSKPDLSPLSRSLLESGAFPERSAGDTLICEIGHSREAAY